ncbi:MAG: 50S ribosomal protein L22 [Bacteroidetes bacterium RBG_19FT_COMBO_42_7]|nr:MAG: 50S ribosomal protein L22 [Bacteroidetes bacterium RBG_13_42_15]OFY73587.1 MAG: 50S ribosomal protein L22 [Bacteroidetes bacterium RBG_19FT_COMBO_42_7]
MGARKRNTAEQRKEDAKNRYRAILRNCPTSPRKMRLMTGLISGMEVNKALDVLKFSPQEASRRLEKLLLSAISNWQSKNEGVRVEESNLYVKEISVDSGRSLKRLQTAPQGRAYRIRKRSNHVTLVLDSLSKEVENTSK